MDPLPLQQKVFRRDRSARKRRRSGGEQADSESMYTLHYLVCFQFASFESNVSTHIVFFILQVIVEKW